VTLRPYQPADFETLYQIDQVCYPRGIAYSKRTLQWFLALPGAECLVAEVNDVIAGFILTEAQGENAHIITIDVLAAHRRAGMGTRLLSAAEQHLQARGVSEVHLETAHDNASAIAFWQKHGYRKRGVLPRYYLDRIDAFWMEKRL
jgi:ribosomal-protein-alanine N-acetyltransferase